MCYCSEDEKGKANIRNFYSCGAVINNHRRCFTRYSMPVKREHLLFFSREEVLLRDLK